MEMGADELLDKIRKLHTQLLDHILLWRDRRLTTVSWTEFQLDQVNTLRNMEGKSISIHPSSFSRILKASVER
jgi:hypothetical protein